MKIIKIFSAVCIGTVLFTTASGSGSHHYEGVYSYRCKPVMPIVDTSTAASIYGSINNASFLGDTHAVVTVSVYQPDTAEYKEFAKLEVPKAITGGNAEFHICWLRPGEVYRINISDINIPYTLGKLPLEAGQVLGLNGGHPI